MSTETETEGVGVEAKIEAIIAELKDAANAKGGLPRFISEFYIADVFADRFSSVFMAREGGIGRWYFRPGPGMDEPREAYREVRHAFVRMISVLTGAIEADRFDRARMERWGAVLNVLEIASWDPRLACSARDLGGTHPDGGGDLRSDEERLWHPAPAPANPVPDP